MVKQIQFQKFLNTIKKTSASKKKKNPNQPTKKMARNTNEAFKFFATELQNFGLSF